MSRVSPRSLLCVCIHAIIYIHASRTLQRKYVFLRSYLNRARFVSQFPRRNARSDARRHTSTSLPALDGTLHVFFFFFFPTSSGSTGRARVNTFVLKLRFAESRQKKKYIMVIKVYKIQSETIGRSFAEPLERDSSKVFYLFSLFLSVFFF